MQNKPIRILQYIGSLNIGGSQSMIMEIYRKIDKNKIQFDFIIDRKNETFYEEEILKLGGKVYKFNNFFRGWNYLQFKKEWNDFFKEHKEYKIIHCHVRSIASIVLKLAKKNRLKTICHSHSTSNGKGIKAIIKKCLQHNIVKYADYLFACSKESAEWLFGKENAKSDKCIIVRNGINIKKFKFNQKYRTEVRKKYSISKDDVVIGHVGRFVNEKNHRFIVDLAIELISLNNNYKFMLCGNGKLKNDIINLVDKYNCSKNFIFIDSNNEIYKYYNAFDLFILPSKYEGLGIVLIEAQYNGLQCFVSNNVPLEARISKEFYSLPLNVNKWKIAIESNNNLRGNDVYSDIYDINNTCKQLCKIYINS